MPDSRARSGPPPRTPQKNPVGEKAAEQLRTIASGAPAPEDAIEPALRTLLDAVGATAGAICLFDQRQELLRLAAEVGLSDEGCRQLRSVRRGGVGTWDMPLHSLLNRRAYLIESAARNRYVPPLVEPASSVRTLACIPLYAGSTALASLVLVAVTPQSFGEREIRVLDPALRELITIIEAVRRRAPGGGGERLDEAPAAAPAPPQMPSSARRPQRATISPELSAEDGDPAYAVPAPERPAPTPRATGPAAVPLGADGLAERLEESERDRLRLAAALEKAAAERAADVTRLMTRLLDAESAGARQTGTSPREGAEDLRRALEAAQLAETARATAAVEAEAARVEATRARSEIQRLQAAEREFGEERGRLERTVAELQTRLETASAQRGPLDEALAAANARADAAAAETAAMQRERDAVAAERDSLRQAAEAAGDADTARADLAQAQAQLASLTAELERLRGEVAAGSAAAETARAAQAELQAQATSADTDLAAARTRITDLESELVGTRAERDRVVAEADGLRAAAARAEEVPVLRAELDATRGAAEALQAEVDRLRPEGERLAALAAQHEAAAAEARAAHDGAVAAHTAALENLGVEHAAALDALRADHESALDALRVEHAAAAAAQEAAAAAIADEVRTLRDERAALSARLDELLAAREREAEAAQETLRTAVEEAQASARAAVEEAQAAGRAAVEEAQAAGRAALDEARAGLEAAIATLRSERDATQSAHDALQQRVDELARERDELRATAATLTAERDVLAAARTELEATLRATRDDAKTMLHAERTRFAAELSAARSGMPVAPPPPAADAPAAWDDAASDASPIPPLEALPDDAGPGGLDLVVEETAEIDAPATPEASDAIDAGAVIGDVDVPITGDALPEVAATTEPAPEAPPATATGTLPPPGPEVATRTVVLDDDLAAWDGVHAGADRELCLRAPSPDTVAETLVLAPARVLANLARPGVVDQLLRLRAAGYAGRLYGYLAAPAARTVLPLAAIEPGSRPLDPDSVIASLSSHGGQGTRVVMVGADVDALISARQALARQGMSVSMAWNAKQAEDLLGMVRPQIVVVDLDLPGRDGYGIVAHLAAMATVPMALVIVGADDPAPRLGALLADPALAERHLQRDRFLQRILDEKQAAPQKKRNVRALR